MGQGNGTLGLRGGYFNHSEYEYLHRPYQKPELEHLALELAFTEVTAPSIVSCCYCHKTFKLVLEP